MRKFIPPLLLLFTVMFVTSCTMTFHQATNNPIGTKTGVASGSNFSNNLDISFKSAAKDGEINKIGTAEYRIFMFAPYMKFTTTLTGE